MLQSNHIAVYSDDIKFKEHLKELASKDFSIIKSIASNFLLPINNGYCPFTELAGKYKPSWEVNYCNSPMKDAFIKMAEAENLYHYHFGYKFYKDGYDEKYKGMVSDGILHVQLIHNIKGKVVTHRVVWIHLTHDPFSIPLLNIK